MTTLVGRRRYRTARSDRAFCSATHVEDVALGFDALASRRSPAGRWRPCPLGLAEDIVMVSARRRDLVLQRLRRCRARSCDAFRIDHLRLVRRDVDRRFGLAVESAPRPRSATGRPRREWPGPARSSKSSRVTCRIPYRPFRRAWTPPLNTTRSPLSKTSKLRDWTSPTGVWLDSDVGPVTTSGLGVDNGLVGGEPRGLGVIGLHMPLQIQDAGVLVVDAGVGGERGWVRSVHVEGYRRVAQAAPIPARSRRGRLGSRQGYRVGPVCRGRRTSD